MFWTRGFDASDIELMFVRGDHAQYHHHHHHQSSQEGAAFVDEVSECPFDIVIPGHGQAPVPDGKLAWQRCFAFVDSS